MSAVVKMLLNYHCLNTGGDRLNQDTDVGVSVVRFFFFEDLPLLTLMMLF